MGISVLIFFRGDFEFLLSPSKFRVFFSSLKKGRPFDRPSHEQAEMQLNGASVIFGFFFKFDTFEKRSRISLSRSKFSSNPIHVVLEISHAFRFWYLQNFQKILFILLLIFKL